MSIQKEEIKKELSHFNPEFVSAVAEVSSVVEVLSNTEVLREGQYIKVIPIVLEGLIKVYTRHDDKELLLYYIKPGESCIMSFSAGLKNDPSTVYAQTEENTKAIFLPVDAVLRLMKEFPEINSIFFQQYNLRYTELLETIHQVLFEKMDKRLLDYLVEKSSILSKNPIKLSHKQIANELGTAREVVSRVMKKLEVEGKVSQEAMGIKILV